MRYEKGTGKNAFCEFFIVGFNYYEGCMAWEELKVGAKLELVRDSIIRWM